MESLRKTSSVQCVTGILLKKHVNEVEPYLENAQSVACIPILLGS